MSVVQSSVAGALGALRGDVAQLDAKLGSWWAQHEQARLRPHCMVCLFCNIGCGRLARMTEGVSSATHACKMCMRSLACASLHHLKEPRASHRQTVSCTQASRDLRREMADVRRGAAESVGAVAARLDQLEAAQKVHCWLPTRFFNLHVCREAAHCELCRARSA